MAQADQQVQNASFPAVRADINDNLAALFSQSSGVSAPSATVAFQPWIDTSSSPAVWKVRNGTNTGWVTVGTIDSTTFAAGGVTPITSGGTGAITAAAALAALLPSQTGNSGKGLTTDGTTASWGIIAAGSSIQVFTATGTYTPTPGKTTFLVFATGGGGGSGALYSAIGSIGGGGGAGTAVRLYSTAEMGSSASITIGAGGTGGLYPGNVPQAGGTGGTTTFDPGGTGLTITGTGGGGSAGAGVNSGGVTDGQAGGGGSSTNSLLNVTGQRGGAPTRTGYSAGGTSFWAGVGGGGYGVFHTSAASSTGIAGTTGCVVVLEF